MKIFSDDLQRNIEVYVKDIVVYTDDFTVNYECCDVETNEYIDVLFKECKTLTSAKKYANKLAEENNINPQDIIYDDGD